MEYEETQRKKTYAQISTEDVQTILNFLRTKRHSTRDSVIYGTDITADFDDALPQENSVLWGESYKSYANGETSALTSEQRAKIWALTISRKGVKGIYLGRPSNELAEGKDEVNNILSTITLGEANVTDWSTETVKRVNHFASFFEDAEENVHYDNGFAVIERGEKGAVLVNMQGKDAAVSLSENTLADGEYTDAITGNIFTVVNGGISGDIGESGIAVLYQSGPVQNYNLWVGGEQFTSEKLIIRDDNGGTATYNPDTNTLTLNGYTYEGEGYPISKDFSVAICSKLPSLTIDLQGENSLTSLAGHGIAVFGNVTIGGTGSLAIDADSGSGISVTAQVTISRGTLDITAGIHGIYGNAVIIDDSTSLTITSMTGINGSTVTISGGTTMINATNFGISGLSGVTISGGTVNINVNGAVDSSYGIVTEMDIISITGGTVEISASTYAILTGTLTFGDALWYQWTTTRDGDMTSVEDASFDYETDKDTTYLKIAEKIVSYTITFNPNGGSVEPETMETVDDKLESLPTPTRSGYTFNGWYDAETGGNKITTDTVFTENTTVYAQWSKRSTRGGSSSNTTTTTTKNEDGSTTKVTENKTTGTKTEVTTNTDGSTTTVETKKDGTVTTTEKDKEGNTTITVEKPDGTSTTTEKNKDGSEKVTENKADGTTVTTEKDTDGTKTVTTENTDGSTTTEETRKDGTEIKTETTTDGETTAEVEAKDETEVVVPVDNAEDVTSIIVTDKDGNETEITDFEITEDSVKITVFGDCTAVINKAAKKEFADVHPVNHWATADIDYAYIKGLMMGTSETHFSPDVPLTRAMLVTVLYRLEGEPNVSGITSFADLEKGQYYLDAVCWAQVNGIVNGTTDTTFAPNDNITREQIAAIMHRYAQYKGYDVSVGENTNILSYDDFDSISEYAISSMQYACGSGLIKGKSESTLYPLDNATRAEIAAILHRFIEANK